jgi:hypothetical protein
MKNISVYATMYRHGQFGKEDKLYNHSCASTALWHSFILICRNKRSICVKCNALLTSRIAHSTDRDKKTNASLRPDPILPLIKRT